MSRTKPNPRQQTSPAQPQIVHPLWLVKAIGGTIVAALLCGYLTLCLLFYQGQWQLVLHPARTSRSPASIDGLPYQLIRFAPDETAIPQLTGWWIPAAPAGRYAGATLLFLPPGDGSLEDFIPLLASLHTLGINIFAIDYRGYGQSAAIHPSQASMTRDADATLRYLTSTRNIPITRIVPYGIGTGSSLAARLTSDNTAIPAVILDHPYADLLPAILEDPRTHLVPARLLFHERFPLAAPLASLITPKLLLSRTSATPPAFLSAATPKILVDLSSSTPARDNQSILRFLDQYLPAAPQPLVPSPAPAQ